MLPGKNLARDRTFATKIQGRNSKDGSLRFDNSDLRVSLGKTHKHAVTSHKDASVAQSTRNTNEADKKMNSRACGGRLPNLGVSDPHPYTVPHTKDGIES